MLKSGSSGLSSRRNFTLSGDERDWIAEQKRKQDLLNSEEQDGETGCGGALAGEAEAEFENAFDVAVQKSLRGTEPRSAVCANDDFFGFGAEDGGASEGAVARDLPPGLVITGLETQSRKKRNVLGRSAQHIASQPPMCDALTSFPDPDSMWMTDDLGPVADVNEITEEEDELAKYMSLQLRGCGSQGLKSMQALPVRLRMRIQYYNDQQQKCV